MLGKIRSLVSSTDIQQATSSVPQADDIPQAGRWMQKHGFQPPPVQQQGLPSDMFESMQYHSDIMQIRTATGLAPGHLTNELQPPFIPIASRNQLLVATIAVGFAGLFVYSLFTKKPLLQ